MTAGVAGQDTMQPFPGLRPFEESEVDLFFGREGQSAEVIATLARHRFAAVLGNSGSGKSSLVRAGVLPALKAGLLAGAGERWTFVVMRPCNDPVGNLLDALQAAGLCEDTSRDDLRSDPLSVLSGIRKCFRTTPRMRSNVLILADQFEELFRFSARLESAVADYDEKAAFVCLLLTSMAHEQAAEPGASVYCAITMRSDYLGECAQFGQLAEIMNRAQYLVPRMTRDLLRQTIEGPIGLAGARIAPLLVQRLLNDTGEDPDQLPLLQHALMRTWQYWQGHHKWDTEISEADYVAIGTIQKALSLHATEACQEAIPLSRGGATVIKRMFQRLRNRDDKGGEVRHPTSVVDLCRVSGATLAEVSAVIDCFRGRGRTFLTPFEGPLEEGTVIDVTHECLLRKWDTLANEWADEEEESRHIYLQLANRAPDDYLRDAMLARALEWWTERQPNLYWAVRYHPAFEQAEALLNASRARRDEELRSREQERQAEEERKIGEARRDAEAKANVERSQARKRAAYILAFLALAVAGFSGFGYMQVRAKSRLATAQLLAAEAAIASQSDGLLNVSALLAAESYRRDENPQALTIMADALSMLPQLKGGLPGQALKTSLAAYSPDGTLIAAASGNDALLMDFKTGEVKGRLHHDTAIEVLQFAGPLLVTLTAEGKLWAWPWGKAGGQPQTFSCGTLVSAIASTPDGTTLACASLLPASADKPQEPQVTVWKLDPGKASARQWLPRLPDGVSTINGIALNANGSRIALAEGQELLVYDVFRGLRSPVWVDAKILTVSAAQPDQHDFYFADAAGSVWAWSADTTSPVLQISSEPRALIPGSQNLLAVGGADGAVKVWDTRGGSQVARLVVSAPVSTISIAPDESELLVIGSDEKPQRYSLESNVAVPVDFVRSAEFSPDGTLAVLEADSGNVVVEMKGGPRIETTGSVPQPIAISPDNQRIFESRQLPGAAQSAARFSWGISGFANGSVGDRMCTVELPERYLANPGFTFSPDGRYLAAFLKPWHAPGKPAASTGIKVWDGHTCKVAGELDFAADVVAFAFTPDSQSIVLSYSGRLKRFDLGNHSAADLAGIGQPYAGALRFSPDGAMLAIAAGTSPVDGGKKTTRGPETGTVTLWRWPDMQQAQVLNLPGNLPLLAFSADSSSVVTAGADRPVRVWSIKDGKELCRFSPGWPIFALSMAPDGSVAVVTRRGVSVNKWKFPGLLKELCGRVDGALTKEEWAHYVPGEPYQRTCPK